MGSYLSPMVSVGQKRSDSVFNFIPLFQVICSDKARPGTFPSWGRKKRSASPPEKADAAAASPASNSNNDTDSMVDDEPHEEVHELLKVYLSRSDIPPEELTPGERLSNWQLLENFCCNHEREKQNLVIPRRSSSSHSLLLQY